MAGAKWWKYGLCVFGGLGIGYLAGVKITKNRAEEEYEAKVADIREIYRNERKAKKPPNKQDEPKMERPDITTKTSIQMEKLSEKKERAEQAEKNYGKAFDKENKPALKADENDAPEPSYKDYIHLVTEFPEDSTYHPETLNYYADGVVTYAVSDKKLTDEEIEERIGEDNLKLLDDDGINEIHVRNDLYLMDYTIIFRYQEWAEVIEEEPYKAQL